MTTPTRRSTATVAPVLILLAALAAAPAAARAQAADDDEAEPGGEGEVQGPLRVFEAQEDDAGEVESDEPRTRPGRPHEAFELLGSPNHFALRDLGRGATGASFSMSYMGDLESDPDFIFRGAIGLSLGLIEDRLRIGLLFPIDFDHQDRTSNPDATTLLPPFYTRGGGSDVRASLGWLFVDDDDFLVQGDIAVWIPSGAEPQGIQWTRLTPGVDLQKWYGDRLAVRGRVGAILDLDGDGEHLGALAVGVDYTIFGSWSLGVQVDGFGGRSGDRDGLAPDGEDGVIGVGAGVGSSVALLDWLWLDAGVRVALTDDYEDQLGRFNFTASLRAADTRHTRR